MRASFCFKEIKFLVVSIRFRYLTQDLWLWLTKMFKITKVCLGSSYLGPTKYWRATEFFTWVSANGKTVFDLESFKHNSLLQVNAVINK